MIIHERPVILSSIFNLSPITMPRSREKKSPRVKTVTKMVDHEPGTSPMGSNIGDSVKSEQQLRQKAIDALNPRGRLSRRAAKNPHLALHSLSPSSAPNNTGESTPPTSSALAKAKPLDRQAKRMQRLERAKNTSTRQRVRSFERKNKMDMVDDNGGSGSYTVDERSCRPGYTPVDQYESDAMTEQEKKTAREQAEIAAKLKVEADALEAKQKMEAKRLKAAAAIQRHNLRAEALAADWAAHDGEGSKDEESNKTTLDYLDSDEDESSDDDSRGPVPLSHSKPKSTTKPAEEKSKEKVESGSLEVAMPSRLQKVIDTYCSADGEEKSKGKVKPELGQAIIAAIKLKDEKWSTAFINGCSRAVSNPGPWYPTGNQTSTCKPNPEPNSIEGRGLTQLYNEVAEVNFVGEKFVRLHDLVLAYKKLDLSKDSLMDLGAIVAERMGRTDLPYPQKLRVHCYLDPSEDYPVHHYTYADMGGLISILDTVEFH